MTLGERIKTQRKQAGLSQEKVAELVGVSRQAVTKWEQGRSAPSTENLFKLAELFGTTVDLLTTTDTPEPSPSAEQIYQLYKIDREKAAAARRSSRKRNLQLALYILGGYLLCYLIGHLFGSSEEPMSVLAWLTETGHLPYLIGWLLKQHLFWIAMAVSVIPALFGKGYFAVTTLAGFITGLILGELGGHNPAGAPYGHGHYGWAIWSFIFLFSIVMGIILERLVRRKPDQRSKKLWIWAVIFAGGCIVILLAIRASMPTSFS